MLNVGASSPLNLHRKALQARFDPSFSNSSHSVTGDRSFCGSNKSGPGTDNHSATDLEGGNNHHPHTIPQNPSLVSFHTGEASPSRYGHGRDQDPPTILNIRLANRGVYDLERSRHRGRSGQRISARAASDSEEANSRSSAPPYTVCNQTFRLGDPSLNATPDICFAVSLTVATESST